MTFGFIGLGDMGLPMAHRLAETGTGLTVWNRTPGKMASVAAKGATVAATPRDVMSRSKHVGLCLTSHQAVEEVCEGQEGLLAGRESSLGRQVIVDFSTGSPQVASQLAERAARHGIDWVDAPVSGGVAAAGTGRLIVFAGGDASAVKAVEPLLARLAARVSHMGPVGSGQATKLCNQVIVACNVVAIAEATALARRVGVQVEALPDALRGGFADSAPLQVFGPRMAARQFTPRLGSIGLMEKDVLLALELAQQSRAVVPLLTEAGAIYARAAGANRIGSDADLSCILGLFERLDPSHG